MNEVVTSSATPDAPVAVTATESAISSGDVAAFREARRAERAGTPLNRSSDAESTPAEPVEQVASTDASPEAASEPATPRKKGAEARIQELLAERHQTRTELDALRREMETLRQPRTQPTDVPAASSPAPLDAPFPTFTQWLETPGNEAREYEDYLDVRAEHRIDVRETRQRQAREQEQRERTRAERTTAFQRQFSEAKKADPRVEAFADSLPPPTDHVPAGEPVGPLHVLSQEIYQSAHVVAALTHFATHPDDVQRFAAFTSADAIARAFGRLEATWETPATPASPPKTVSSAPPPPTTFGSRPSDPGSATDAAVVSGDMAAYKAARLKERVANLR